MQYELQEGGDHPTLVEAETRRQVAIFASSCGGGPSREIADGLGITTALRCRDELLKLSRELLMDRNFKVHVHDAYYDRMHEIVSREVGT